MALGRALLPLPLNPGHPFAYKHCSPVRGSKATPTDASPVLFWSSFIRALAVFQPSDARLLERALTEQHFSLSILSCGFLRKSESRHPGPDGSSLSILSIGSIISPPVFSALDTSSDEPPQRLITARESPCFLLQSTTMQTIAPVPLAMGSSLLIAPFILRSCAGSSNSLAHASFLIDFRAKRGLFSPVAVSQMLSACCSGQELGATNPQLDPALLWVWPSSPRGSSGICHLLCPLPFVCIPSEYKITQLVVPRGLAAIPMLPNIL